MFKKFSVDLEDIKKAQMKLLEVFDSSCLSKNTLSGIEGRLDIAKKKKDWLTLRHQ